MINVTHLLYSNDRVVAVSPSLETLKDLACPRMDGQQVLAIRTPEGALVTYDHLEQRWSDEQLLDDDAMASGAEGSTWAWAELPQSKAA